MKHLKYALYCSIGLNLLFAGAIVGHISSKQIHELNATNQKRNNFLLSRLSEPSRKNYLNIISEERNRQAQTRREMRQARNQVYELLQAERFNAQKYNLLVKRTQELKRRLIESQSGLTVKLANTLQRKERAILADYLRKERQKRREMYNGIQRVSF